MTTSGSSSRCWPSTSPKYRLPDPNTTGATSIATSSTRPNARACPPTSPAATATVRSPASSFAFATACATSSTKWYDASGCHPSGLGRCDTTLCITTVLITAPLLGSFCRITYVPSFLGTQKRSTARTATTDAAVQSAENRLCRLAGGLPPKSRRPVQLPTPPTRTAQPSPREKIPLAYITPTVFRDRISVCSYPSTISVKP